MLQLARRAHLGILFGLGFFLPLVFSHMFVGVGWGILGPAGYEFLKKSLLGVGLLYLLGITYLRKPQKKYSGGFLWWCIAGVFIMQIIFGTSFEQSLFGSSPFYYGLLHVSLILATFQVISGLFQQETQIIRLGILSSFPIVALYAVSQYTGYDFLDYAMSFENNRVFATLGNPAQLALYGLLMVFLVDRVSRLRFFIYPIAALVIYLSGTYWIGGILLGIYLWEGLRFYPVWHKKIYRYRWYLCLSFLSIIIGVVYTIKSGTLQVRVGLVMDTVVQFLIHPRAWIMGFTPGEIDVIYTDYMTRTSPLIDSRFAIGHTHNLFLEAALRFGLLFTGGIAYILLGIYRSSKMRHSIGFPVAIFCLVSWVHMPEITHFFMLAVIIGISEQNLKKLPKESL